MSETANSGGDRRAGLLLHPSSLPGVGWIGEPWRDAEPVLDWMAAAGLRLWQLLPLGPVGPHGTPYTSGSSFAGNPLLISVRGLVASGWLDDCDEPAAPGNHVDLAGLVPWKTKRLREAWSTFRRRATPERRAAFETFVEAPEQAVWLEDWALFAALHEQQRHRPWLRWPSDLRARRPAALRSATDALGETVGFQRFVQFVFFEQWRDVRRAAANRGIELLGDLPFYPALDSADVWSRQELFRLDETGRPSVLAGVPPDYFSESGQLWGNPVYDWDRLGDEGYRWWIERVRAQLRYVDRLRLDHFRGFAAAWEVPAGATTAADGRWREGPGREPFDALRSSGAGISLIAEDLGEIGEDVHELRRELGLPGMYVLQFGIGDPQSHHHPSRHTEDNVVYTGTHDNDTTAGWFRKLEEPHRQAVLGDLETRPARVVERVIERAYHSPAATAVVPLQDHLGLGSAARMNRPGRARGNWGWRCPAGGLDDDLGGRLDRLAADSGRR